ncbi:MFS transporter [Bacteroidota bacterium]
MAEVKKKSGIKDLPFTYWISIIFEFFERGSYYGVMSILSVYMVDQLGFAKDGFSGVGTIRGFLQFAFIYGLPLFSGAVADKLGYKKTLLVAFGLLGSGYILASQTTDHLFFFLFLVIMGIGAGTFKPVISGTIAKVTDEGNSTTAFGIFYWTINLGAFLVPLFIVPVLKELYGWNYVLLAAGIGTGAMIIPTLFVYKEPPREKIVKEPIGKIISGIFEKVFLVFKDWRFILFIFIYSWFWILYFQMFGTVLWYVQYFVDPTSFNVFVNNMFGENWLYNLAGINYKFGVEFVTVINAGTIIALQIVVTSIVRNTKALPTMLTGIALGTLGMAMLAISNSIWIFMAGIIIFSIGEMTAHPKFISYLGTIAPADKKATYMGFGFLYGMIGALVGEILGANLYTRLVDNPMINFIREKLAASGENIVMAKDILIKDALEIAGKIGLTKDQIAVNAYTDELWIIFSGIGVICIIGLLAYGKFIGTREASDFN